jgi:hypothetical protein
VARNTVASLSPYLDVSAKLRGRFAASSRCPDTNEGHSNLERMVIADLGCSSTLQINPDVTRGMTGDICNDWFWGRDRIRELSAKILVVK